MKIGTITFHFASNQGAVLQCYALKKYLEKQGHEVSVIDYQPTYHTVRYKSKKNPFVYARGFWKKFSGKKLSRRIYLTLRSFIRCVYMNMKQTDRKIEECFDSFRNKHLNLTKEYKSISQLRKDPPEMDAYISGSDQLWNPELLDQSFDEAYFLRFGKEKTERIAYAVSIGKAFSDRYLCQLKNLCADFDAISLREYNKSAIDAIGKDVHVCVDPTFLLQAEDYQEAEGEIELGEPYIFVYGFESNSSIFEAIEAAKRKYNCRVINGSPTKIKYQGEAEKIREYGPDMFLSYIKHASCVVTNSFHATTFSIIYQKQFVTVPHSTRGMRMKNLLGRLGLCSCLYGDTSFNMNERIDYTKVQSVLSEWRAQSEEFLSMALEGKQGEMIPHYSDENYTYNI